MSLCTLCLKRAIFFTGSIFVDRVPILIPFGIYNGETFSYGLFCIVCIIIHMRQQRFFAQDSRVVFFGKLWDAVKSGGLLQRVLEMTPVCHHSCS